jgi:hypothetical protein
MIPPLVEGVSGVVRVTAGYAWNHWAAAGRSDRLFYYHTDWKHQAFRVCLVSEGAERMLSGWVAAARLSPRNVTQLHLPQS